MVYLHSTKRSLGSLRQVSRTYRLSSRIIIIGPSLNPYPEKSSNNVLSKTRNFLTESTSTSTSSLKPKESLVGGVNYNQIHQFHTSVMRCEGLWGKIQNFFSRKETMREKMERNDLYMALLSSVHKDLRLKRLLESDNDEENPKDVSILVDEAETIIETDFDAHFKTIRGLRVELQNQMEKEVVEMFRAMKTVENMLPKSHFDDNDDDDDDEKDMKSDVDEFCKKELLEEIQILTREIDSIHQMKDDSNTSSLEEKNLNTNDTDIEDEIIIDESELKIRRKKRQVPFLKKKLDALNLIINFKGWKESNSDLGDDASNFKNTNNDKESDPFGYYPQNDSDEMVNAVRYHQMINMTRAKLLRTQSSVGFSIVALQSTVPTAGRGVFVDGYARAGSLLGFFPGDVWPKEYLMNMKTSTIFEPDDNFQLSLRYDDILIDSRKSPYTVLDRGQNVTNPFALAHVVNHPPSNVIPNCRTMMINFTKEMGMDDPSFNKYIPNKYARNPMLLGAKAFETGSEDVIIYGFALYAARDLCNEELFYDYRLSPGPTGQDLPSWYHVYDEEQVQMRWHRDT